MAKQTTPKAIVKEESFKVKVVQPIVLGTSVWNEQGILRLREITEDEALIEFAGLGHSSRIINAWKIANGKK